MKPVFLVPALLVAATFSFWPLNELRLVYGEVKGAVEETVGLTGPCGPVDLSAEIAQYPEQYVPAFSYGSWRFYVDQNTAWKGKQDGSQAAVYTATVVEAVDGGAATPAFYRFLWDPAEQALAFYDWGGESWIPIPLYTEEKRAEIIKNEGYDQYLAFYHVTEYEIFKTIYRIREEKEFVASAT